MNTCLPGILSLPSWYVNQMDFCTPTGRDYMFRTSLHCDQELHDAPTAGHRGIIRLLAAMTRTFWWHNMKRTVQHYVRSCVTCQRNKAARHKPYGLLQSHEVPTMPFEHVSSDMITDLLECDGYDALVVFVYMLTKRTVVEPITKTITAEQLAKVMHRAVLRHFGLPRKLIFDRDPRFMSDL
jgi:hypothetical protein